MEWLLGPSAGPTPEEVKAAIIRIYQTYAPEKLSQVDSMMRQAKGSEADLLQRVKEKYGADPGETGLQKAIARREYKKRLDAFYAHYSPDKVPNVPLLMDKYEGKEENLIQLLTEKYGPEPGTPEFEERQRQQLEPSTRKDSDVDPPKPRTGRAPRAAPLSPRSAPTPSSFNTSLPPDLQDKQVYYSGFLWEKVSGWLTSRQRRWCLLIGQQFFIGNDPTDQEYDIIPLEGCTVRQEPSAEEDHYMFRLTSPELGSYFFYSENEVELLMWGGRIEVALLQANPSRHTDAKSRQLYSELFTHYSRPCVPLLRPPTAVPEKMAPTTFTGYLVSRTGDSWLGSDWGRRYVTLHDCWYTIRPDKASNAGLKVLPLRDAQVEKDTKGVEYPWAFSVWSSFIPCITLCGDGEAAFKHVYASFMESLYTANPDRSVPPSWEDEFTRLEGDRAVKDRLRVEKEEAKLDGRGV